MTRKNKRTLKVQYFWLTESSDGQGKGYTPNCACFIPVLADYDVIVLWVNLAYFNMIWPIFINSVGA